MKAPAFQFYPGDFLVGVTGMTNEEVGIYIKLLCLQWERGPLPSDQMELRRLVGIRKPLSLSVLTKFKTGFSNSIYNERLEQVREKQIEFCRRRSENAKTRWDKQHTQSRATEKLAEPTDASALQVHMQVHPVRICKTHALHSSSSNFVSTTPAQAQEFDQFWSAYPKKRGKEKALKAWKATARKRPPIEQILAKIEAQAKTADWQKEGGQFIPFPATWLNQGRWEDELMPAVNSEARFSRSPTAPSPEKAREWAIANVPSLSEKPFSQWHPGYQQDFLKANGN